MQRLAGKLRKAIEDYNMISPGDKIAVGVSGGKDSLALLAGLMHLKRFIGIDFSVIAVTLDLGFNGEETDYSTIQEFCDKLGIQYVVKRSQIAQIIFDVRKEKNPCSLCARMRRGLLHDTAKEYGCNKIALGHHYDDAIETFFLNLFYEGRAACFSPVSYLSRKDLTMIRPMVYVGEDEIKSLAERYQLPIVKSICPLDTTSKRAFVKNWIRENEVNFPELKSHIFTALHNSNISGW